MLESVKRKEREIAVAAVKAEILNEKRYVTKYEYGMELLSMDHQENEPDGFDNDMAVYGAKSTSSRDGKNHNDDNADISRKLDPFSKMNHETWGEEDSTMAPSSSRLSRKDDSGNGCMKQITITADPKLIAETQKLEELRLQKLQEHQQEEEARKKRQLDEEEERKRKKEAYEEQTALLSGRKTKLSFSIGKKKLF